MSVDDAFPVGRRLAEHPWPWIVLISASVSLFLFWLIYFKGTPASGPEWVDTLPAFNALFNALSATCLVAGFINIRRGNWRIHIRFMLSAVAFSLLFLTSYVTYHHFHGDTPFPGEGWVRLLYFFILISHVTLSVVVVPLSRRAGAVPSPSPHRPLDLPDLALRFHHRSRRLLLPPRLYVRDGSRTPRRRGTLDLQVQEIR